MCKECAPSIPVTRMLGNSGFGDYFGCVEDTAKENIQEIFSLGSVLMCNYTTVMGLKILARDSTEMWESLKSHSDMMFAEPLMCW